MQSLKTLKPFEVTSPLRKQTSNLWMLLVRLQKKKTWESLDCKTVVFFFFAKSVKKSVKRTVRVLRARSARASFSVSPQVSLSVFSLAPDLLFDCSRVHEYAKIRTVLQSRESFVFPHCKTTTFYPHLTSSFIHNLLPFIHFADPQRTTICLRASSPFGWLARSHARAARERRNGCEGGELARRLHGSEILPLYSANLALFFWIPLLSFISAII